MPHYKLHKQAANAMSDCRFNEVIFAHAMADEPYEVQARLMNSVLFYILAHARNYEIGLVQPQLYEISKMCKTIKDYALSLYEEPVPSIQENSGREFLGV